MNTITIETINGLKSFINSLVPVGRDSNIYANINIYNEEVVSFNFIGATDINASIPYTLKDSNLAKYLKKKYDYDIEFLPEQNNHSIINTIRLDYLKENIDIFQ